MTKTIAKNRLLKRIGRVKTLPFLLLYFFYDLTSWQNFETLKEMVIMSLFFYKSLKDLDKIKIFFINQNVPSKFIF